MIPSIDISLSSALPGKKALSQGAYSRMDLWCEYGFLHRPTPKGRWIAGARVMSTHYFLAAISWTTLGSDYDGNLIGENAGKDNKRGCT